LKITIKNCYQSSKENFPVDGDFIIGIPARDLLFITGSKNKKGVDDLRKLVFDSYNSDNYRISDQLFKWTGTKFEKYE
jgi:uncharacterized protein YtpQ (UPF0354 family)